MNYDSNLTDNAQPGPEPVCAEPILSEIEKVVRDTNRTPVPSCIVFNWPETQALLKRLGVPLVLPIRDVEILLPFNDVAEYRLTCLGTVETSNEEDA